MKTQPLGGVCVNRIGTVYTSKHIPPRIGRGHGNRRDSLLSHPDSCPTDGVHLKTPAKLSRGRIARPTKSGKSGGAQKRQIVSLVERGGSVRSFHVASTDKYE